MSPICAIDTSKVGGKEAWLKISQIRVLSTDRIGRKIGKLKPELMAQAVEGLNELVGT